MPPGKGLNIHSAHIKFGTNASEVRPVQDGAHFIEFFMKLDQGSTTLKTWFTDIDGRSFGAYYATIAKKKIQ